LQPDILVLALGAPKQELWLTRYVNRLPVKVALGVGGSWMLWLDRLSGRRCCGNGWVWNGCIGL